MGKRRPAFDLLTKNHALKILVDYATATGRGWQQLRNEIIDVTKADATEHTPLLTRQDLEAWTKGRSVLGDAKFALVYGFLTHPLTLKRPELAHAAALKKPIHNILRMGRSLAEWNFSPSAAAFAKRQRLIDLRQADADDRLLDAVCGIYTARWRGHNYCLAIRRYEQEKFLIAHYLSYSASDLSDETDWQMNRMGGFVTVGGLVQCHLKAGLDREARLAILAPGPGSAGQAMGFLPDGLLRFLSDKSRSVFERRHESQENNSLGRDDFIEFRISNDSELERIIENLGWSVPI